MAPGRKVKATLASVAAQSNVSKITASRAFSHPEKVHPDTLRRVLETAQEMGYVVNTAARNLRARASKTIGIVNPDMGNPFFGNLTKLMTLEAQKAGYDTLVFDSWESQEQENRIIDKLIGYGVDAIVLSVISADQNYRPAYFERLALLNIPIILVDRELDIASCSGVYIDNLDCGLQAGRFLQEQQAQRVVVVSGPDDSNVARERVTGVTAALQGKIAHLDILYADFYMDVAWQVTTYYLNHQPAPDYFVGCNNQISQGIIKSCIDHRLRPMQDVSVFSIDEIPHAAVFGFNFPCIAHDLYEMAWQAINLAVRRASDSQIKPGKVIIRGKMMV
ncbi:HTH-type transcriptional repressor CytR [Sodalis glossinidius str. 'morsitans']|uniref:HTH-type transcriptional repressor CytR n=1 Tax=Sodalis glossinidius (strain morsitans) TaxID=343509 RepID=Q2NVE2_SODGM|nr:LacI family DNA-binding transcriptional regulator [Sodalis glossinidius]BAE73883.1 xylitol repressor [Sodalis glossinidius str. 'morsitans']CRL44332.1 HTH-type transcriptional repressor CytR [Sodalis glossinidius str. 'morsitans']